MPFERGAVSFRMLMLPRNLPGDAVERFARDAAPVLGESGSTEARGWVTGRHLMDRNIQPETAVYGGYLRLTLLLAERKIPATLLNAECRMEELAHLEATGEQFVNRKTRTEIRTTVMERLLPQMPFQLKGLPFVHHAQPNLIYATALSEKDLDLMMVHLQHSLGFNATPCLPETLSLSLKNIDTRDIYPVSFSPEIGDAEALPGRIGEDFLTWLWFMAEAKKGIINLPDLGQAALMVEGPLKLVAEEGSGAQETVLRKGEPLLGAETKTSLLTGKKLSTAKLTLALDDQTWTCTFDAREFVIRSLKLPETDAVDSLTRFQDRMLALDTFKDMLFRFYERFLDERATQAAWKKIQPEIHDWVKNRKTAR